MSSLWLFAIGVGSPAVGLLVGRYLGSRDEDVSASVRRYHDAVGVLEQVTTGRRP